MGAEVALLTELLTLPSGLLVSPVERTLTLSRGGELNSIIVPSDNEKLCWFGFGSVLLDRLVALLIS